MMYPARGGLDWVRWGGCHLKSGGLHTAAIQWRHSTRREVSTSHAMRCHCSPTRLYRSRVTLFHHGRRSPNHSILLLSSAFLSNLRSRNEVGHVQLLPVHRLRDARNQEMQTDYVPLLEILDTCRSTAVFRKDISLKQFNANSRNFSRKRER